MHAFHPSTQKSEEGDFCESKANLVSTVASGQQGLYKETLTQNK